MFTPARRNFGPRETRRFQSRPWIARTAHAERRGGTSTPQVQCQTVRADAHRRVLRPAPGLRLDVRHVDEILRRRAQGHARTTAATPSTRRRARTRRRRPQEVDDAAHAVHGPGRLQAPHGRPGRRLQVRQARRGAGAAAEDYKRGLREERRRPVWKSTSVSGAMTCVLAPSSGDGASPRHRAGASMAWRSALIHACRKILISTQAATRRRPRASPRRPTRPRNSALSSTSSWPSTRR